VFGSNILLTRWIVFGGRARIVEGASSAYYKLISLPSEKGAPLLVRPSR
jgi:hypothetical protein